jgi:uncharacterized protein (DUF1810 family)
MDHCVQAPPEVTRRFLGSIRHVLDDPLTFSFRVERTESVMHVIDLDRFLQAQANSYTQALDELRAGKKQGHWMWFVLPQLQGLGQSGISWTYGIRGRDEAIAYLAHPVLGARLRECVSALLAHRERSARAIFGQVDAMKLRSCLTLFVVAVPEESIFPEALAAYFGSQQDPLTLSLLAQQRY